jgi:hypothetical protein
MIVGLKKGQERVEEQRQTNDNPELFIPNIGNGSDKLIVRILSDVGAITTHNLWGSKNPEDMEYIRRYRRYWDFCIQAEGECPHCAEYFEPGHKTKQLSTKFIVPVLAKAFNYVNKKGEKKKIPAKVGYILLPERQMKAIDEVLDEVKKEVGDNPNYYLTYADIKLWKSGSGTSTVLIALPQRNNDPLSGEELKLVLDFFDIKEYTPEKVEEKLIEYWTAQEKDAIDRLSNRVKDDKDTELDDDGDIPDYGEDDENL